MKIIHVKMWKFTYFHSILVDHRSGRQLWRRFPDHIKEILLPLLDAKYVPASSPSWTNIPKPIYRSKKGKTYKDWACAWTGYLVTKVMIYN